LWISHATADALAHLLHAAISNHYKIKLYNVYRFGRKGRIERRKKVLGERFTSDLSTRKFYTEKLKNLNCALDFSEVTYICQIG
jgi:hypothetical protein